MFKRASKWFILLGMVTLILGACSEDKSSEVVATVNGEEILKTDYETELENTKNMYTQQGMNLDDLDDEMKEQVELSVLNQLVNTKLVLQSAKEDGITVEQSELDSEMDAIKSQFEDDAKYEEKLKENKITEKELKVQVKNQLTITKYLDSTIGKIEVNEDEVTGKYEEYKKALESQKQEPEDFKTIKPQLEQQVTAEKKNEKVNKLIEDLRTKNEKNIDITL
ncbi:SurA N-terminal domain-containing protein [Mesobacillus maritimus]|uniref:SurA N-terminal domain-containing protein n=1 Tax=Mesobacillus maritimus TaxID=1643336 RepID=A0ABS7K9F4_9BACI|nr:SurA N-terminal domain-containing protein [Mesobacillus maritimus]MBY0098845.1 SurA N-terminal domain-containing protein [Mesobacillus maritimus]